MAEIKKFDLNDAIRTRVREAFFDAIPPDVLDGYIKNEVNKFFADSFDRHNPSEFRKLVWGEINNVVSPIVAEWIKEHAKAYLDEHGDPKFKQEMADAVVRAQYRFIEESLRGLSEQLPRVVDLRLQELKNLGRW